MHLNQISGKAYIGLTTKTMMQRWSQHCYTAYAKDDKGKFSSNTKFHKAIRKYGIDVWLHVLLYDGDSSELTLQELEIYYIKKHGTYVNGYNGTLGGDGIDSDTARKLVLSQRDETVKGYSWHKSKLKYIVQLGYLGKILQFERYAKESDAKARADYLMSLSDSELMTVYTEYKLSRNWSKGYTFNKAKGKYCVQFTVDGKSTFFGYYTTKQEAIDKVASIRTHNHSALKAKLGSKP